MLALALASFVLPRLAPGGPALFLIGPDLYTPEREAIVNRALGLDQPIWVQLVRWAEALGRGDLGYSYFLKQPAGDAIRARLPATLELSGLAFLLAMGLGCPLGALAAARADGWIGRLLGSAAVVCMTTPGFWLGIVVIFVFSAWLGWLPSAGMYTVGRPAGPGDHLRHLALPLLAMTAAHVGSTALYTRAAVADCLRADYVRTAHAKGLPGPRVLWGHVLRNAAIPVITVAGLNLPHLVGGSVVIETLFAWPGIGQLTATSVTRRDYPVLLSITMLLAMVVVISSAAADVAYHAADPRVEHG